MPMLVTIIGLFAFAAASVLAQNAPAPATPPPTGPKTVEAPPAALFPFVLPWDDAAASPANLAAWLDAPAGGRGFVTAKDGHLSVGNKRLRMFGVNVVGAAGFPAHEEADKMAARLAKFGVGCVRFRGLDAPAPEGLLQADRNTPDPAQLEKLDYFFSVLKKNGIYADLCLHAARTYPGLPEWEGMPEYFKGVDNFEPRLIESQRAFARALLTHVNAYTQAAYVNEPAVAFIEINHESSLLYEWWNGTLDAMPAPYADGLRAQWNRWLSARYGTAEKLRAAWNAHEEPAGKEMLGDPTWGWWSEHPQYPTEVKLERIEEKRLFCRDAAEQAVAQGAEIERKKVETEVKNAAKAARAKGGSPDPGPAPSPASAGDKPKPKTMGDIPGTRLHVKPGKDTRDAQYVRQKVAVDATKAYTFAFEARSARPRRLTVSVKDLGQNYKDNEVSATRVQVTPEWQTYRVTFVPARSVGEAQFGFTELGRDVSDWEFADLSLKPAARQGLHESEGLGTVDLFRKREFHARTAEAQRDWVSFLLETETNYWAGMQRFLKEELRARSLVIGTQVNRSPFPVQAQLDVVDVHGGWQLPRFRHVPGNPADWAVRNSSLIREGDGGAIGRMGAQRVAGKPYICSEFNAAAPNTYSSEAFLLLGAYAALQDWDAIFANAYASDLAAMKSGMFRDFFDIAQHPAKMATLPTVAALFVRGDVAPGNPHVVAVTPEQVLEQIRRTGPVLSAAQFGARQEETLRHPLQITLGGAAGPGAAPQPSALPGVTSDTLDLRWDRQPGVGLVTVDTARSAGVIGYVTGTTFRFMQVSITPHANRQNWATVNLTVLEGADFAKARRVIVVATGYVANTGMLFKDPKEAPNVTLGKDWGKAPAVVEGVGATITFPLRPGARAWALDGQGQRKTEVPVRTEPGATILEIGPAFKTLWYELEMP